MIDLSVVIVSWNTRDLLEACLASLQGAADGLAVETLVVDNASADGSAAMIRQRFPQVQLIDNTENAGYARANNQAIRQCAGRHVMLLNSDTVVRPGALAALVRFMDTHPAVGAAGPYLEGADGSLQPSCHPLLTPGREFWRLLFLDRILPRATYPMHRWPTSGAREVEVIKGACLVLRHSALDQVGLLDEQYFMYTEEMDLCLRLALAGWRLCWVPEARVVHFGAASTRQAAEAMYLALYRSKVQFQRKFWGQWRARCFKVLVGVAYVPRWVAASIGRFAGRSLAARAHIYQRLLTELPSM